MHKNGVVLSPPFQNDLSQMKDAWFPTWCKLQKNAKPILLCHKLIFRRCWKARKCNYGKIALRQTSTCQVLPFSITHLSPLIVADNAPSVCALSEGEKHNPKSSAWMEEWEKWGQLPEEAFTREPLQSYGGIQELCQESWLAQELWLAEIFGRVTPHKATSLLPHGSSHCIWPSGISPNPWTMALLSTWCEAQSSWEKFSRHLKMSDTSSPF